MKRSLAGVVAGLGMFVSIAGVAQERGSWRAASKTAQSITGDVAFSGEKLFINFSGFTIAEIRPLQPAEITAAFDLDGEATGSGHLYRLSIPGEKRFLHKNSLCGSDETQWMATYVNGKSLRVAFFSGAIMPLFTRDRIANSGSLCGTFAYGR